MRVILFTRPNLDAESDFIRMIKSLETEVSCNIKFSVFALFQHCKDGDKSRLRQFMPEDSVVLVSAGFLSLSEARNQLLIVAQKHAVLDEDCVISFPGANCWYPPGFVNQLVAIFSRYACLDMLACRVSPCPVSPSWIDTNLAPATAFRIVRRSSSNGLFLRGQLVKRLEPFDETININTSNGSEEDTGYAVRALLAARRTAFVDLPLVGCRDSDLASAARYYQGSLECARAFSS